jgi:hypothetical protein
MKDRPHNKLLIIELVIAKDICTMDEFVFNLCGVEEFNFETNSRLRFWFNHIRENALKDDGNIFEFGVYQGASLIAVALILRELGSKKKVYGFDSFEGFPSYSQFDELQNFYRYKGIHFDEEFINKYELFLKTKEEVTSIEKFSASTISTQGDFSNTSYELIKKKIEFFELENVEIIKGSFADTVEKFFGKYNQKISSANIDCDLYDGYRICLPFIYDYLFEGGYVHLDEYYSMKFPGAKIACDNFFKEKNITPRKNIVRTGEFERWYFMK